MYNIHFYLYVYFSILINIMYVNMHLSNFKTSWGHLLNLLKAPG